jgi:hypothetical protein
MTALPFNISPEGAANRSYIRHVYPIAITFYHRVISGERQIIPFQ